MLDVFVQMPGASRRRGRAARHHSHGEAAARSSRRRIPVFHQSQPGMSLVIVRFYVGQKEEDAIVRTYNKLFSNFDRIPPGVSQPLIKVRSIDDVPILALTLWGKNYDSDRCGASPANSRTSSSRLDDVSETKIIGGQPRQVRVVLDPARLAAYGLTPGAVAAQLESANQRRCAPAASPAITRRFRWKPAGFSPAPEELQQVVVGVHGGEPGLSARRRRGPGRRRRTSRNYYVLLRQRLQDSGACTRRRVSRRHHHPRQAQEAPTPPSSRTACWTRSTRCADT